MNYLKKNSKLIAIGIAIILVIIVLIIIGINNKGNNNGIIVDKASDSSDFVLLSEVVPDAILEIRYYSTYNFVGDRIDGYEEPCALLTKEAATALKEVSDELVSKGYRLKYLMHTVHKKL